MSKNDYRRYDRLTRRDVWEGVGIVLIAGVLLGLCVGLMV